MQIKMIGPVLFVADLKKATQFYSEVLGQRIELDFGVNVGFIGGLGLWQHEAATETIFGSPRPAQPAHHHNAEFTYETEELEEVCRRLDAAGVELLHPLTEQAWGARSIRFYDPDGYLIELSEPMPPVVRRMLAQGKTQAEVAQKTGLPLEYIRQVVAEAKQ